MIKIVLGYQRTKRTRLFVKKIRTDCSDIKWKVGLIITFYSKRGENGIFNLLTSILVAPNYKQHLNK